MDAAPMPELRIALTLPGEASLGTFEAGAVSALLVGAQAVRRGGGVLRIDAMAGASSGSLTAVLAARALLTGQDPVRPLHRAWVTEPSLGALDGRFPTAPMSLERARQVARELISEHPTSQDLGYDVVVEPGLACLRGFRYRLHRADGSEGPLITSYADWAKFTFRWQEDAKGFTRHWARAVDAAIASASHPLAFPATLLDREADRAGYEQNEIADLPEWPLELWYADGALLDRQPLGRCLALVREQDGDADGFERVVLLVRTDTDRPPPPDDRAWADPDDPPEWTETLVRSLRLVTAHSVYGDLRRLEKTNGWLKQTDALARELAPLLDEERATEVLGGRPEELEESLRDALRAAAGLKDKREVRVELIEGDPADLAGAGGGRFGGFLAERARAQDFLVGYQAMVRWMEDGLPEPLAAVACPAARERGRTVPGWLGGRGTRRRLSLETRGRVARIGLRAAAIGVRDRSRRRQS